MALTGHGYAAADSGTRPPYVSSLVMKYVVRNADTDQYLMRVEGGFKLTSNIKQAMVYALKSDADRFAARQSGNYDVIPAPLQTKLPYR